MNKIIMRKTYFYGFHEIMKTMRPVSHMYYEYSSSIYVLQDQVSYMYYKSLVQHVHHTIGFENMTLQAKVGKMSML